MDDFYKNTHTFESGAIEWETISSSMTHFFFYSEKITVTNINFLPRLRIGKCEMLKNVKTTWMRRTRDDVNNRDIDTNARTVNKVGRGMEVMPHLLLILQRSHCKLDSNDGINSEDVRFNREASFQFDITIYLCINSVHRGKYRYIFKINNSDVWVWTFRCWFSGSSSRKKPEFSALRDFFAFQQFVSVSWNYYRQLHSVDYKNGKTCIYIVDVDCQNHITRLSKCH